MTIDTTELVALGRRLVGEWTTEGVHPAFPGVVVHGRATVEWLGDEKFVIMRSSVDHPDFPDSVAIIGDTKGLRLHWFDSRGVHRVYEITITGDTWEAIRHQPASAADFSQRIPLSFADGDRLMGGTSQVSHDDITWEDDLVITYRRSEAE